MSVKITFTPEASQYLKRKQDGKAVLLLALNDGSNQYSLQGGTCTIGANFQFVALDEKDANYTIPLVNDQGFDLYTGQAEMGFLDENLHVAEQYGMLSLSDGSGLIDASVGVNVYEPSALTAEQIQNGASC